MNLLQKSALFRINYKSYIILIAFQLLFASCNRADNESEIIITGSYTGDYFPTNGWRTCSPDKVGMNSAKLEKVYDYLEDPTLNTDGFLVIRKGHIVAEAYYGSFGQNDRHVSYSVAKSFVSSLVGIAIANGFIDSVTDKIVDYYPQLQVNNVQEEKKQITIEHLLTMTAGFEWNEEDYYSSTTQNDVFIMAEQHDYIEYVLNKTVIKTPGSSFYYSSGESVLLSGVIENATGQTTYKFAKEYLLSPLGISNFSWSSDPAGHTIGGWGINATLREYAKFGYLYLHDGNWDGNQIIPEVWVEKSLTPFEPVVSYYGYQWWIGKGFESFNAAGIPDDTFMGVGIYRQYLIVIPSQDLVIVRMGNDVPSESSFWNTATFISLILDAIIV